MNNLIVIDNIEYPNFIEKEPEYQKNNIHNILQIVKIFPNHYNNLQKDTMIYYKINDTEYGLGELVKYIHPNYFILKNDNLFYIWTIDCEDLEIFIEHFNKVKKNKTIKNNLFRLYNEGLIKILDFN